MVSVKVSTICCYTFGVIFANSTCCLVSIWPAFPLVLPKTNCRSTLVCRITHRVRLVGGLFIQPQSKDLRVKKFVWVTT